MLNAIWQVADNSVYMRSSCYVTHVQIGRTTITMSQYEMARITFRPDLELVTPSSFTATFIYFFKVNMLAFQVLANKYGCSFDILAFKLNAKRIISTRKC